METVSRTLITFLLNALWQVPVAWAIAALACRLMPNGPARHRHAVWVAALCAACLLPVLSVRTPRSSILEMPVAANTVTAAPAAALRVRPATTVPTASVAPIPAVFFPYDWAMLLLGAYGMFLAFRVIQFLRGLYRAFEIRRDAAPGGLPRLLERCETAFSTSRVELLRSEDVTGPVALHRTILLPDAMFDESREDVLATAVGHEMAHIARYDFVLKLLYEFCYLPISFHPAAIFIHRGIENSREMACDELVTRHLLEPAVYAQSIVTIASGHVPVEQPGYVLGVFDGDILEERIRSLMERRGGDLRRARVALAGALSALAMCLVFAGGLTISGYAQSAGQAETQAGGEAFIRKDFAGAVEHFQNAVQLEPNNLRMRLFLANAYVRQSLAEHQYFPVSEATPLLVKALDQYREVQKRDPKNATAIFGVISLTGSSHAGESRDQVLGLIASDPGNNEAYYTLGTLDWMIAFDATRSALEALGADLASQQIPDATVRTHLRERISSYIDEGLRALQIVLAKDPNSDSAMAYINLLLRSKGLVAATNQETSAYVAEADGWVSKALNARRVNAARPKVNDTFDVNGEPGIVVPVPPPPPPPPPPGTAPKPRNAAEGGR